MTNRGGRMDAVTEATLAADLSPETQERLVYELTGRLIQTVKGEVDDDDGTERRTRARSWGLIKEVFADEGDDAPVDVVFPNGAWVRLELAEVLDRDQYRLGFKGRKPRGEADAQQILRDTAAMWELIAGGGR